MVTQYSDFMCGGNGVMSTEKDPNDLRNNEPGAKMDYGKAPLEMIGQFGLPLEEVAKLLAFGADKYTKGGWKEVLGGKERYTSAMLRHLFKEERELYDPETGLYHATAVAWNALARLYFVIKEQEKLDGCEIKVSELR